MISRTQWRRSTIRNSMSDPSSQRPLVAVNPREVAAAWQPQRPGRRSARDIPDALVEPEWGGLRVAAALTVDDASLFRDGEVVPAPEETLQAMLDAFGGIGAVIEGHLTTAALRTGEGAFPAPPQVDRMPMLVPRVGRGSVKDDPYVHGRVHEAQAAQLEPETLEALERGEPHAFVATDLLWLDGQALDDVPLLERKRLLEAVLAESYLVRVSAFVRPSSAMTLVSWGTLGFAELSYRGSNSRYLAGRQNNDWAVARAPDSPVGRTTALTPR
jgi:ATP-dependent DNA ligase